MDYKNKYLKYKGKYLALKELDISTQSKGIKDKYLALKGGKIINIFLREYNTNNRIRSITIEENSLVSEFKSNIREQLGIIKNFKIYKGTKELDEEKKLVDCDIYDNSELRIKIIKDLSLELLIGKELFVQLIKKLIRENDADTQTFVSEGSKNLLSHPGEFIEINQQIQLQHILTAKKKINIILIDNHFFELVGGHRIHEPTKEELDTDICASSNNNSSSSSNSNICKDLPLDSAQIYGLAKLQREIPDIPTFTETDNLIVRKYTKPIDTDLKFISRYKVYYDKYLSEINAKLKDKIVNWYIFKITIKSDDEILNIITDNGGEGIIETYGYAGLRVKDYLGIKG
jgi:hypothetical protein